MKTTNEMLYNITNQKTVVTDSEKAETQLLGSYDQIT